MKTKKIVIASIVIIFVFGTSYLGYRLYLKNKTYELKDVDEKEALSRIADKK